MVTETALQPSHAAGTASKSIARFVPPVVRVLLGLPYFVGGLNGLLHFLPEPQPALPAGALVFVDALIQSGYMFPLIMTTQLVVGALLLSNRLVPLALVLIAPFTVNSIAFHTFLEHGGLPFASVFLALELYLAWAYRDAYRSLLVYRSKPQWR